MKWGGRTYCWLRFACCTCWICWGAGLLRDGSITPGITGRDTGLFPYPGGPMAGPCGFMRLEGGMPGLCTKNIGKTFFLLISWHYSRFHKSQTSSLECTDIWAPALRFCWCQTGFSGYYCILICRFTHTSGIGCVYRHTIRTLCKLDKLKTNVLISFSFSSCVKNESVKCKDIVIISVIRQTKMPKIEGILEWHLSTPSSNKIIVAANQQIKKINNVIYIN